MSKHQFPSIGIVLLPDLSDVIAAERVGGGVNDLGRAVAVVPNGDFIVTGTTLSTDWPTTAGALARVSKGQMDGILMKIRP